MAIWAWVISAVVLVILAARLGIAIKRGWLGILVDSRGRYSLTQFQLTMWTIVVLSLVSGVFWARVLAGVPGPLDFTIPDVLLLVMGISVGSTAAATAVKASKDASRPASIAASEKPSFMQIFLLEEGALADQVIDVTKYQNFWITLILLVAYIALAASVLKDSAPAQLTALPEFSQAFIILLAISHGAYLAGKIPDRAGVPSGLSVALLSASGRR